MSNVNKVILLGNLGNDPEIKYAENGKMSVHFSLATNDYYKSKTNERVSRVDWHNVVLLGRVAALGEKYLKKSKQVYIEGKIIYKSFEGKNGEIKYIAEIVAHNMILLGGPRAGVPENKNSTERFEYDYMP